MLTPSRELKTNEGVLGILSMHSYPQSGKYSKKMTTDLGIDAKLGVLARPKFIR